MKIWQIGVVGALVRHFKLGFKLNNLMIYKNQFYYIYRIVKFEKKGTFQEKTRIFFVRNSHDELPKIKETTEATTNELKHIIKTEIVSFFAGQHQAESGVFICLQPNQRPS
jgi:hypothetical protein